MTTVPDIGVGHCLGPKGSGDSSRGGGEGGQGPQARKEISSQHPAKVIRSQPSPLEISSQPPTKEMGS